VDEDPYEKKEEEEEEEEIFMLCYLGMQIMLLNTCFICRNI